MNRLVRSLWVMSNIPGRIWEPIVIPLGNDPQIGQPGPNPGIDHIMHVSGHTHGHTGQKSSQNRDRFLLSYQALSHSVPQQLPDQRTGKRKHQTSLKRPHQIVSHRHLCSRQLRQKDGKILSAVIIVDILQRIPKIFCRKRHAAHHRLHKTIIHKFFRPIGLWAKSRQISPQQEHHEENKLLPIHQVPLALRQGQNPLFRVLKAPYNQQDRAHRRDSYTGGSGKRKNSSNHQHPSQVSRNQHSDHLREHPASIGKAAEQPRSQRLKQKSQYPCQHPPAIKRNTVFAQQKASQSHHSDC
ncbi:unknown [Blautia hydrogenotrophica CAG:147]|nr:unknown [Blautia hydrogenotrophica CAG:147]